MPLAPFPNTVSYVQHLSGNTLFWHFQNSETGDGTVYTGWQCSADAITWQDNTTASSTVTGTIFSMIYAASPATGWYWRVTAPARGFGVDGPLMVGQTGVVL